MARSGYFGPRLEDLIHPDDGAECAREIAEDAGEAMLDFAISITPVESGNMRSAWYRLPAHKRRGGWVSEIRNGTSYAEYVDRGTGLYGPSGMKYEIVAKPGHTLSWVTRAPYRASSGATIAAGTRVFAKRVWHPGSRGQHITERAASYVDSRFDRIAAPAVARFAARVEGRIARGG